MKRAVAIVALVACMAQQAGASNLFERYTYQSHGKWYYGYRPYAAPKAYQDNHSVNYNLSIRYEQPAAKQGDSLYGVGDIIEFYGEVDLGEKLYQAQRLAEGAQKLSATATSGYLNMLGETVGDRTRIAEILAKGQAAAQALTAANAQASATVVKEVTGHAEASIETEPVNSIASIEKKCLACHGGEASRGGDVKLPAFSELSGAQADAALEYITLDDDRNCADKAKLSGGERKALVKFLCPKAAQ